MRGSINFNFILSLLAVFNLIAACFGLWIAKTDEMHAIFQCQIWILIIAVAFFTDRSRK